MQTDIMTTTFSMFGEDEATPSYKFFFNPTRYSLIIIDWKILINLDKLRLGFCFNLDQKCILSISMSCWGEVVVINFSLYICLVIFNNFTDNTRDACHTFVLIYMMMHKYPLHFNQLIL